MNWDNGAGRGVNEVVHRIQVNTQCCWVYVSKSDFGTQSRKRESGGNKRERRHDHVVMRLEIKEHRGQLKGRCARGRKENVGRTQLSPKQLGDSGRERSFSCCGSCIYSFAHEGELISQYRSAV